MKFLLTGGAGFIGSHLTDELLQIGHQVTVLDDLSTGQYKNVQQHRLNENFQFVEGSILNEFLVDKLVERCDAVFHLAAAVGVTLIVEKPLDSLITNIKGSEIVLNAAHRYHKKILITSTSEIYGKNTKGPLKEEDDRIIGSPQKVRWGYSIAKGVDEMLAYIYWKQKNIPTIVVRLFNTVGPRQTGAYGMVVPRLVKQALKGEDITIYGDGQQSRCFLHVKDCVGALVRIINHEQAPGKVFNIGSQEETTIQSLAEKIINITNSHSKIIYIPYDKAYEEGFEDMQKRVPDITKINQFIGFSPSINLEGIIHSVVDYIQSQNL